MKKLHTIPLAALVSFLLATSANAQAIIADLLTDYTSPTFATGWRYQWNATGALNPLNLTDLVFDGVYYDTLAGPGRPGPDPAGWLSVEQVLDVGHAGFLSLHPGKGATQPGNLGYERFCVVSYEIQPGEAGPLQLVNLQFKQFLPTNYFGDGTSVQLFKIVGGVASSFFYDPLVHGDTLVTAPPLQLGSLAVGDRVLLALGAGPADYNDSTGVSFQIQSVPEPATCRLTLLALLTSAGLSRSRRAKSDPLQGAHLPDQDRQA